MTTLTDDVGRGAGKRKPFMTVSETVLTTSLPPKNLKQPVLEWRSAIWRGDQRWLGSHSDQLVVELICSMLDRVFEIEADLNSGGRCYFTKHGQELPRPGVAYVRALRAQVVSRLSLLAFSPRQRAEMGVGDEANNILGEWPRRHDIARMIS